MTRVIRTATTAMALMLCLLLATSCSDIMEPVVTMTGVDVKGISMEGIAMNLLLDVENPNAFGANIGDLDYTVMLDNTEVASGMRSNLVAVPAAGTVEVAVPFSIRWSGVDQGIKKLLDGKEHEWHLKGSVKLSKGALSKSFRFSEKGTFDAPRAGDIEIDF